MNPSRCCYWVMALSVAMLIAVMPGCGGCRQDPLVKRKKELEDLENKKKKKENSFAVFFQH